MLRTLSAIAIAFTSISLATPAAAAILVFERALAPEVAGATGSGFARATFDTDLHELKVEADWSGLSGVTTVAHIHCCTTDPETGTVGVAVTPGTFPGFPVGVSAGTYSTTLNLANASVYTASFLTNFGGGTPAGAEAALLAGHQSGRAYLNIHSSMFPAGEIRGFLLAVPEPQTWGLMIMGFGLAGAVLRRARGRSPAPA